ncbi:insulinase family protein, partial [Streptomyces sp. W16]|nr:insulinase family protein [Streptomyces sp. W16]
AAPARRTGGQTAALVVLFLLGGLFAFLALAMTAFGGGDPDSSTGEWLGLAGFLWAVTGLLVWPAVRILRRTRRT